MFIFLYTYLCVRRQRILTHIEKNRSLCTCRKNTHEIKRINYIISTVENKLLNLFTLCIGYKYLYLLPVIKKCATSNKIYIYNTSKSELVIVDANRFEIVIIKKTQLHNVALQQFFVSYIYSTYLNCFSPCCTISTSISALTNTIDCITAISGPFVGWSRGVSNVYDVNRI